MKALHTGIAMAAAVLLAISPSSADAPATGVLTVQITSLRSNSGQVGCMVYNSAECGSNSAPPQGHARRDGVEPCAMAVVAAHRRPDDGPVFHRHDKEVGLQSKLFGNHEARFVPRPRIWEGFVPQRDDGFLVVLAIHAHVRVGSHRSQR